MKVCHWTMFNKSGMYRVAESFALTEKTLGVDAVLCNFADESKFDEMLDADVHVVHTHLPDKVAENTKGKVVWVGHGSVEHTFQTSVEAGTNKGYGASDSWMLCQYWLQHADALVTFWPRQQAIWQSMCDKHTCVEYVKMGVDLDFWKPIESRGRFLGKPSVFSAENCHYVKWPLDLFIAWPWVYPKVPGSWLHVLYLPNDQHRWFFPLINRNSCAFRTVASAAVFGPEELRNAFCSVDYFIGLVRYGDHNRLCMEANACGMKSISYTGNMYSDFWIHEGDQRVVAEELTAILLGKVAPREKEPVPSIIDTAKEMIAIYGRIT